MDPILAVLRHRIFSSTQETVFFEKEMARLVHTIRDTVINGVSNSLLIIGRRGCGKSHLLRDAIKTAKKNEDVKNNLVEIYINGLIHTTDLVALRAIAKQLQFVSTITSSQYLATETDGELSDNVSDCENVAPSSDVGNLPIRNFSDQLKWLLSGLCSGDSSNKAVLIVLEEFDLFAAHRNQALLYNLLDCCQSGGIPLCVFGVTCRLDIMELLEKRVKSRFSHRQLHLLPVASMTVSEPTHVEVDGNHAEIQVPNVLPFTKFCQIASNFLIIDASEVKIFLQSQCPDNMCEKLVSKKLVESINAWNKHIREFFDNDLITDCLRQMWDISTCVGRLKNFIALVISRINTSKMHLEPVDFISVLSKFQQDAKTSILSSLPLLELILISVMVKLHDINSGQPLNFEKVFQEYTRFCRTSCPGYLYEKGVVSKAMDNLKDLELIVSGKEALATVSTGGVGLNVTDFQLKRPNNNGRGGGNFPLSSLPTQLRNFQPIVCFVNSSLITSCLDVYPGCPIELSQWLHSRTL